MSVNYKLIADNDPGGELETAFAAMAAETVSSTPEVMVTYRQIGEAVSLAASAELETAINDSGNGIPSWVDTALTVDGINVNDPQVADVLGSLSSSAAAITAMGVVTTYKYQGLKMGHLQNAREKRILGEV